MKRAGEIALTVYKLLVVNLFEAIIGILLILAAFFTCFIDKDEKTYFVQDSVLQNLLVLIIFFIFWIFLRKNHKVSCWAKQIESNQDLFQKCRRTLLFLLFGISVFWILTTQYTPGSDQEAIQNAVQHLHTGENSMFQRDGYLGQNGHQLGLVWIYYILSFIAGSQNFVALQLLNALGLLCLYNALAGIGAHLGMCRVQQLQIILSGILFFPLIMYCSFLYGNVCGLAFSIYALKKEMDFLLEKRGKDFVSAALLITLAILFKTNSLIFLIGMILLAVEESIRQRKAIYISLSLVLIVCAMVGSIGVRTLSERVSGNTLEGSSYWAYIAMGLQEAEGRAPGWYNGYVNDSWKASGFDKELQGEAARKEVGQTLKHFVEDPDDALSFLVKKTASQWNNPTFQCYNIVQWRESGIRQSKWVREFVSANGADTGAKYLNFLEFIILVGAFLYCLLFYKRSDFLFSLCLAVIFIGGFCFHIVWEAKGQYTISYFVLLIPYALAAYDRSVDILEELPAKIKSIAGQRERPIWRALFPLPAVFIIIFFIAALFTGGRNLELKADTERYYAFLEEQQENG